MTSPPDAVPRSLPSAVYTGAPPTTICARPARAEYNYIHSLVSELVAALASEGATFVVPFGKEPLLKDREDGPSIIFDWTVAEAVIDALKAGKARASGPNGRL